MRRQNGSGSVYYRSSGRWAGALSRNICGRRFRKTVYGKSKEEVEQKIRIAKGEFFGSFQKTPITGFGYPDVPRPNFHPTPDGSGVPSMSGIYFVWEGSDCVYVGQSVNLSKRLNRNHGKLKVGDMLSWVMIPKPDLNYAECFYIGIMRPSRNFA